MNFQEARSIVESITYKPGWSVLFDHCPYASASMANQFILQIRAKVQDADNPTAEFKLLSREYLFEEWIITLDEKQFVAYVFDFFVQMEKHEAAEFFKVRGVKTFDPHASEERKHA